MDEPEKLLQSKAPLLQATDAPSQAPPPRAIKALDAALARTFGKAATLNETQMRFYILQILSESALDGIGVVEKLAQDKVALKTPGEGMIYGLLSQLERKGAVEGRWREVDARMTKTYHVTERGSGLLAQNQGAIDDLGNLVKEARLFSQ